MSVVTRGKRHSRDGRAAVAGGGEGELAVAPRVLQPRSFSGRRAARAPPRTLRADHVLVGSVSYGRKPAARITRRAGSDRRPSYAASATAASRPALGGGRAERRRDVSHRRTGVPGARAGRRSGRVRECWSIRVRARCATCGSTGCPCRPATATRMSCISRENHQRSKSGAIIPERQVDEVVRVLLGAVEEVAGRPVGERPRDRRPVQVDEPLRPERGHDEVELERVHQRGASSARARRRDGASSSMPQLPTSARIAPGPSAVLPWPS